MKHNLFFLFFMSLILLSCKIDATGTWKNENIDPDKKEKIKVLNGQLLKAIHNNDPGALKALASDHLLGKHGKDLEGLVAAFSADFKSGNYQVFNEFNVRSAQTGSVHQLRSDATGNQAFSMKYLALNKEGYISLLLPDGLQNEYLLTAIYGKYGADWKLDKLYCGQYKLLGKNAPEFYELAKASYDKSYLVDAINYSILAEQVWRPAGDDLTYDKSADVVALKNKALNEINAKIRFPLILEEISSKPQVYKISPERVEGTYCPMVFYRSTINIDNVAALKAENEQVKKAVNGIFTGINKDKKAVFYKAFNGDLVPGGKQSFYTFFEKTGQ